MSYKGTYTKAYRASGEEKTKRKKHRSKEERHSKKKSADSSGTVGGLTVWSGGRDRHYVQSYMSGVVIAAQGTHYGPGPGDTRDTPVGLTFPYAAGGFNQNGFTTLARKDQFLKINKGPGISERIGNAIRVVSVDQHIQFEVITPTTMPALDCPLPDRVRLRYILFVDKESRGGAPAPINYIGETGTPSSVLTTTTKAGRAIDAFLNLDTTKQYMILVDKRWELPLTHFQPAGAANVNVNVTGAALSKTLHIGKSWDVHYLNLGNPGAATQDWQSLIQSGNLHAMVCVEPVNQTFSSTALDTATNLVPIATCVVPAITCSVETRIKYLDA